MTYTEKKRSMFLGLPWTFTSYTVTDEIITINNGLLRKEENDCYLYKVIDVRLESTLLERMLGLGTIHCFTGDVTDPDLKLCHIKHSKEIKDFILKQSEEERMKRIKHAASGRQSSHEPNGRDRQLQIKSHSKGQVCYRPVLFAYN